MAIRVRSSKVKLSYIYNTKQYWLRVYLPSYRYSRGCFVVPSGTIRTARIMTTRCCSLRNSCAGIVNQSAVRKKLFDRFSTCFREISDTTCFLRQQYRALGRYLHKERFAYKVQRRRDADLISSVSTENRGSAGLFVEANQSRLRVALNSFRRVFFFLLELFISAFDELHWLSLAGRVCEIGCDRSDEEHQRVYVYAC